MFCFQLYFKCKKFDKDWCNYQVVVVLFYFKNNLNSLKIIYLSYLFGSLTIYFNCCIHISLYPRKLIINAFWVIFIHDPVCFIIAAEGEIELYN